MWVGFLGLGSPGSHPTLVGSPAGFLPHAGGVPQDLPRWLGGVGWGYPNSGKTRKDGVRLEGPEVRCGVPWGSRRSRQGGRGWRGPGVGGVEVPQGPHCGVGGVGWGASFRERRVPAARWLRGWVVGGFMGSCSGPRGQILPVCGAMRPDVQRNLGSGTTAALAKKPRR